MARIDALQPQVHDGAVLAGEGHHVRHGGDGRQIDALHGRCFTAQRVHQLEGHARAAEPGEGIVVAQGIDHRALRQDLAGAVVVGDDAAKAQRLRQLDQIVGGHAAVHRHQQLRARGDLPDRALVQAVALAVAGGQVHLHIRANFAQIAGEDGRCAHAVHIVVAVDADALLPVDGGANAHDRLGHVAEQHGIVQLILSGVQEGMRLLHGGHAALHQQAVQHGGHALRTRKIAARKRPLHIAQHVHPLPFA